MIPLTYDQAEFVLILFWPAVNFLIFAPINFLPWDKWDMPAGVSFAYDLLWMAVIAPFAGFMDWSIRLRPSPFVDFADWYFGLWSQLLK